MQSKVLAKHFQKEEFTMYDKSYINDAVLKYWIEFMLLALGTQPQIFSSI